jgi:hypothetical protein
MTSKNENIQAFNIKDCAILNIATGVRAKNLKELRDQLLTIHPESIHYHFWAKKLRPDFEGSEYNNDFASWAYGKLHDNKLAERLSLINPGMFSDTKELRKKLIEVIELSLEEDELTQNTKEGEQFQFTRSDIVLFDTGHLISNPGQLKELIPNLPLGAVYYHFIESNNISSNIVTFVKNAGDEYSDLAIRLSKLDPYFFTLPELQSRASQIFKDFFQGENR